MTQRRRTVAPKSATFRERMHLNHRSWDEMTAEERGRIEDREDQFKEETDHAIED